MSVEIVAGEDIAGLLQGISRFGDATAVRWFATRGEQALDYAELA